MKQKADWYRTPKEQRVKVVDRPDTQAAWMKKRLNEMRVQPVTLTGTFISKQVDDMLVLGFFEPLGYGNGYGINLISKEPRARHAEDHGTSPFIGRRVRVTIETVD